MKNELKSSKKHKTCSINDRIRLDAGFGISTSAVRKIQSHLSGIRVKIRFKNEKLSLLYNRFHCLMREGITAANSSSVSIKACTSNAKLQLAGNISGNRTQPANVLIESLRQVPTCSFISFYYFVSLHTKGLAEINFALQNVKKHLHGNVEK